MYFFSKKPLIGFWAILELLKLVGLGLESVEQALRITAQMGYQPHLI